MRHFAIDETREDRRGYSRTHVWYQRHFWSWYGPVWPVCWLRGHRPALRWNGGMSFVECGRCPARPYNPQGLKAVQARLDRIRPGRGDYATARQMEPPTPEESAFVLGEVDGRGAWSQTEHEFKLEIPIRRRPRPEFSLQLHIGGRGSETPWDGHLTMGGSGVYWGLGFAGHMAERLTGGRSRDIGLSVHNRRLWWKLWDTPGEWRRDQPRWWQGSFSIDPTEWIWGRRRYTHDDIGDPITVIVTTAEGTVHDDVVLQLQRQWRGWEKRPRPRGADSYTVKWDTRSGFPYRFHDWKGDEVLGSSETLNRAEGESPDWKRYAIEKIRAHVTRLRLEEGWTLEAYERSQRATAGGDAR